MPRNETTFLPSWESSGQDVYAAPSYRIAGGSGGSSNSFETISTSSGTSPVADSSTDTLTLTGTSPIVITGNSAADTITISTTSATVPAPTTIYDHLESSDGSTWSRVQALRLNSTQRINFNGTTSYIFSSGGSDITINGATGINQTIAGTTRVALSISGSDLYYLFSNSGNPFAFHWTTSGSTLDLYDTIGGANVFGWGATFQRFVSTNKVMFNQTSEFIHSSTSSQLDLGANAAIVATPATSFKVNISTVDVMTVAGSGVTLASSADLITTTGQLELNGANGSILQYNGSNRVSATSAGVTLFAGAAGVDYTITLSGETNSGVLTWMEDEDYLKFSDDILMNSTERIYFNDTSQSIYGSSATKLAIEAENEIELLFTSTQAGEYFNFTKAAAGSDYKPQHYFLGYNSNTAAMAQCGYIEGYVVGDITDVDQYHRISTYVNTTEELRLERKVTLSATTITANFFPSSTGSIVLTDGAGSTASKITGSGAGSGFRIDVGNSADILSLATGSAADMWIVGRSATLVFGSNTLYYGAGTLNFGVNSSGTSTITIRNSDTSSVTTINIGTSTNHVVNIISSSEWAFTTTTCTVGDANNFAFNTSTGTKIGTGTTQKIGFWNATPTTQPANTDAINALLVTTGLRASGGTSNFTTRIDAPASTTSTASIEIPAGTAPTSPVEGDLWNDSTQKCSVNFVDGIKVYGGGILYSQVTNKAVANTVTETTLLDTTNATGTLTLPANWWTRGKLCRITATGVFSTKSGTTPTGRVRLFKGSTELATSGTKTIPDITGTTRLWTCVFYVTGLSTSFTSVMTQGMFTWTNAAASIGAQHGFEVNNQTGGVSTAVTISATSEALDLKWTWGTADALDTITCTNVIIEAIA